MKFGIAIFPTDYAIPMTELAPALEMRGFESLWVAEHTHIPVEKPWPKDRFGGELPKQYWHALDPFVALTAAAVVTSSLKVGTGVCLLIERDPIVTAKEVASLDHISNGRFLFGIGGGWNRGEMADHGTNYETRWTLLRERAEAMKEIWTKEEAEYHGRMVNFDAMLSWPKPVQKPHPPVILGGNGPNTLKRVVRYADGWMPNRGDIVGRIPELHRLAEEAGRGPIPVTAYGSEGGGAAEIERYLDAGVERMIYYVPADGRDAALSKLEHWAELVQPYAEPVAARAAM
jgi:probable F420-dependent oxidoreductase